MGIYHHLVKKKIKKTIQYRCQIKQRDLVIDRAAGAVPPFGKDNDLTQKSHSSFRNKAHNANLAVTGRNDLLLPVKYRQLRPVFSRQLSPNPSRQLLRDKVKLCQLKS
jgi:hypothetical protein